MHAKLFVTNFDCVINKRDRERLYASLFLFSGEILFKGRVCICGTEGLSCVRLDGGLLIIDKAFECNAV